NRGDHRARFAQPPRPRAAAMTTARSRLGGVIPVAPTAFTDDGDLDLASQRRMTDFLVDAGSDAICILANWSEQFALSDAERDAVADAVLEHAAGRVPVVVRSE